MNTRYRVNLFRQLILQVEDWRWDAFSPGMKEYFWRDATVEDITLLPHREPK